MNTQLPTVGDERDAAAPAAPKPAKPPVAAPMASVCAVIGALALVAVGVVAARDALLSTGVITGSPWVVAGLTYLDGLTAQAWMLPAGVVVAVLGCVVLIAAVKPRRTTHQPLREPGIWITAKDCTRLSRAAAEAVTGVAAAAATGSGRRRVALTVTPVAGHDTAACATAVKAAVDAALSPLARPPRVRVRIKEQDLP